MCPSSGLLQNQQCVFSVVNISCGAIVGYVSVGQHAIFDPW